jgi:hypothetical protein
MEPSTRVQPCWAAAEWPKLIALDEDLDVAAEGQHRSLLSRAPWLCTAVLHAAGVNRASPMNAAHSPQFVKRRDTREAVPG